MDLWSASARRLIDAVHICIVLHVTHALERGMAKLAVMRPAAIVNLGDDGWLSPDDILASTVVDEGRALSLQPARISAARADLRRDHYPDNPPHMVAALSFGFWVTLLGAGGRTATGDRANYEMTIWRAGVFKAFPNAKLNRKSADTPLDYLRTFRNRIAHHEPIFDRPVAADYASLQQVAGWISPETLTWINHNSCVPALLAQPPADPGLKF